MFVCLQRRGDLFVESWSVFRTREKVLGDIFLYKNWGFARSSGIQVDIV